MNQLGNFALCLSFLLSSYGFIGGLLGAKRNNQRLVESTRHATIGSFISALLSMWVLAFSFINDDYTNHYVWQFSNRDMSDVYKFTAIWGGMNGSMLLWGFLLTCSAAIVALNFSDYPRDLMKWSLPIINSSVVFFIGVTTFITNPFQYIKADFIPPDGNGLNPLLQNPYMAIHPPMLYLGFTTFAVPFAFCIGALLSGSMSNEWIIRMRRWTLMAWGFLTVGIVLGGHWAYIELGWGGFWAWDPVENASFLPWLTGTAFVHSVIIQERKNMLKMWNIWLIVLTYGLTVFGTFLTRSGVVQSVHAFAETDVGWVFLVYLAVIFLAALILTIARRGNLRSSRSIESVFSREAAFLLNNLLFLSLCFAILWGVLFPVLSEAVTGTKQTVGIPFFNAVTIPLFLVLIALMGVGTLISWRKANLQSLRRTFLAPFLSALVIGGIFVWAGITEFYPVLSYSLCVFVLFSTMREFHRGIKAQKLSDSSSYMSGILPLFRRHTRRYGGYIVHLGVLVMTVAITASMAHKTEKEFSLAKGESYQVGRFTITLQDYYGTRNNNYEALVAEAVVSTTNDNKQIATLRPEMRYYLRKKRNL